MNAILNTDPNMLVGFVCVFLAFLTIMAASLKAELKGVA